MNHELLWAPWRMSYIRADKLEKPAQPKPDCFFCAYRDDDPARDGENYVLRRGESTFVVLNRYPYNSGHLLIAPLAHKGDFGELTDAELLEAQHFMQKLIKVMSAQMHCEGFNVGLNLGKVAGAGLPGHLHWHIVPRWNGDHNFMPITANTHIMNQSLEDLYQQLDAALA